MRNVAKRNSCRLVLEKKNSPDRETLIGTMADSSRAIPTFRRPEAGEDFALSLVRARSRLLHRPREERRSASTPLPDEHRQQYLSA